MKGILRYFYHLFIANGMSEDIAELLNLGAVLIGAFILMLIVHQLIKRIFIRLFRKYAKRSKNSFDDHLVQNKTFDHLAYIIPILIVKWILPAIFIAFPKFQHWISIVLSISIIIFIIWTIRSVLRTCRDFLKSLSSFQDKPIDSYVQVFMIIVWIFGITLVFSTITGQSVLTFLTALGAMSAVILLIFKDTILGFVASIQVAVNDTVRIGDWITMAKYGADGDVVEINLSSVKVQNFDKTITTIPTYYLTSESFRNWRGMLDSGGRRIKRSLIIRASSIQFLSPSDIAELEKISLIKTYLQKAKETIHSYNDIHTIDKSTLVNGRNLTNIGVFRTYVESYLQQHSYINKDMMIMCRQLAPTTQGTSLEIYAFSTDKEWKNYETIVGDIFDHLLATIPHFQLELFEQEFGSKS